MPKYLCNVSYTAEGIKGLAREGGSARRAAVEKLIGDLGGKLEAFYFAFGETTCTSSPNFRATSAPPVLPSS